MLLDVGDKVLVAHRRLFEGDESRFFVGRVDGYEAGLVKVSGWSYVHDVVSGQMVGKDEIRTKIISLSSGTLIVYQLPRHLALEGVEFGFSDGRLRLTDGAGFSMNLSEVPVRGAL
jgi:hypothetical protein